MERLGEPEQRHDDMHECRGFAGDCVLAMQRHFVDRLRDGGPFETEGRTYLRTLLVLEALYEADRRRLPVAVPGGR
jgi:hypothetical protein